MAVSNIKHSLKIFIKQHTGNSFKTSFRIQLAADFGSYEMFFLDILVDVYSGLVAHIALKLFGVNRMSFSVCSSRLNIAESCSDVENIII